MIIGVSWEIRDGDGDALKFFKKSEAHFDGGDDLHGADGEWRVEEQRLSWEILDALEMPPTK